MTALLDIVKKGSTDRSVTIRIVDSSDGTPETGVVYNTSGIDLWYRREGETKTSITEADLSTPALDDAHADGGFLHISDGEYRLDLPDAAFATGANYVDVGGTVTGMVVIGGRVRLIDVDLETALSGQSVASVAGAVASVTGNVGGNVGGNVVGTVAGVTPAAAGAQMDLVNAPNATAIAAIQNGLATMAKMLAYFQLAIRKDSAIASDNSTELSELNNDEGSGAGAFDNTTDSIEALRDWIGDGTNLTEAGGTGDHLSAIPWNSAWDAEVQSEAADALVAMFTDAATLIAGIRTDLDANSDFASDAADTLTAVNALNDLSSTEVNDEVVDALTVDTYAEIGQGNPPATTSLANMWRYMYKGWRNKTTQTATELKLYADDGTTVDQKATVSDDGTTVTRGEMGTGA